MNDAIHARSAGRRWSSAACSRSPVAVSSGRSRPMSATTLSSASPLVYDGRRAKLTVTLKSRIPAATATSQSGA